MTPVATTQHAPAKSAAPFFSIITVCRNAAGCITAALQSLADQTCQDWEWIMVDGASTDDTVAKAALLQGLGRRQQIISEPDTGIYNAMNKGLRLASGRYVHFLNADDSYHDSRILEDVAAELQRMPDVDFLYGNIIVKSQGFPNVLHRPPPADKAMEGMVCGCLPHQGSFARHQLFFHALGFFDESLRIAADYQWMLGAVSHPEVRLRYMDRIIANYCSDGASSELAKSLPEGFQALNAHTDFQQALGLPRMLGAYQRQVLSLRLQLQDTLQENARLASELDRAKAKLVTALEKRDKMRQKLEAARKQDSRSWWRKWL